MTAPTIIPIIPTFPVAGGVIPSPRGRAGRGRRAGEILFALAIALAATTTATPVAIEGGGEAPSPGIRNTLGDDEFFVDEVFQSHLPTTLEKYSLRFSLHPHLGDWERKDHMRFTTRLRYGLTQKLELSVASNLYFSHGNGNVHAFDRYGAANLRVGAKFNLGRETISGWESAAGFDFEFPTGRPPAELTDGLRHFQPYVTFSHRMEAHEHLRIFWGLRADQITHTSLPGEFARNALHDSSAGVTGGWVLDRDLWHYTFEASLDTTRWISRGDHEVFTLRPGVIWEIPSRHRKRIRSNWMVGVALKSTFGPGGNTLGASLTLRYSSDLKSRFRRPPPVLPAK